jgi:phage shock protein PspC (stress-responsive transcriptional regulator)
MTDDDALLNQAVAARLAERLRRDAVLIAGTYTALAKMLDLDPDVVRADIDGVVRAWQQIIA